MYFSTLNSNMLLELLYHPQVLCERILLSPYHCVSNMVSALYYIFNIVWAWKHNHNEDSRHVSPIKDSRHVSPIKDSRHVSPIKDSRYVRPIEDSRHVSSIKDSRQVTPIKDSRHVSPTEDSGHVSPIKDSQTVQSQARTATTGQKTTLRPKTVA
jgi:hypothetical protein